MVVKNSATTAPIRARPAASRKPASRYGTDDGRMTSNRRDKARPRNERETSMNSGGTERAPSDTLTTIEKNAATAAVASRASDVKPNQSERSGRIAVIGTAKKPL